MEPIPFRSLLITAGILTRDGRMVEPGGVTWNTPMTLFGQLTDSHGGDPGPTVPLGRIDTITQQGNEYWADGFLTTDDGIYRAAPMIADLTLNGISCDLAPSVIEYRAGPSDEAGEVVQQTPEEAANPEPVVEEAEPVERMSVTDYIEVYVEVEIVAATVCGMPAFGDSYITLATAESIDPSAVPTDTPAQELPVSVAASGDCGCVRPFVRWTTLVAAPPTTEDAPPDGQDVPDPDVPQPDNSSGAMIALMPPEAAALAVEGGLPAAELHITLAYLGDATTIADPTELQAICTELAASLEPGTGRIAGPAAFVNDPDPETGEAEIPLVALIDSQWITAMRATLADALDASGISIPSEHGFIPHMTMRYSTTAELLDLAQADLTFPSLWLVIGGDATEFQMGAALTASAIGAAPELPPAGWFNQPKLDGPTPLTVDDHGRVFGHIATWGTCHTGFSGQCITAPRSKTSYSYFHLGEVVAEDRSRRDGLARIPVGSITLDTTHADLSYGRRDATLHYENTGNAVADVRAGEDRFGIWVAGAVRPDVSSTALRRLRAAKISGDWRGIGGNLELIGALAVNVPGFPVPRTEARVASGVVVSLVAPQIDALATDDELIDAYTLMAEHGDQAIDVLAASAL